MKISSAFDEAARHARYMLPFQIVSTQDRSRAGGLRDALLSLCAVQSNTNFSSPLLTYNPARDEGQTRRFESFTAEFTFLQSDSIGTIDTGHHEPPGIPPDTPFYSLGPNISAKLTISRQPFQNKISFKLKNVNANVSFNLELQEVGELWMGLGSPRGNNTAQLGWIVAFGEGRSVRPEPS